MRSMVEGKLCEFTLFPSTPASRRSPSPNEFGEDLLVFASVAASARAARNV